MSNIIEIRISVPAEHEKNVFGQFDEHIKKIEKTLNVTLIARDGALKIIGNEGAVNKAKSVFTQLVELSFRRRMWTMSCHFRLKIKKLRL